MLTPEEREAKLKELEKLRAVKRQEREQKEKEVSSLIFNGAALFVECTATIPRGVAIYANPNTCFFIGPTIFFVSEN